MLGCNSTLPSNKTPARTRCRCQASQQAHTIQPVRARALIQPYKKSTRFVSRAVFAIHGCSPHWGLTRARSSKRSSSFTGFSSLPPFSLSPCPRLVACLSLAPCWASFPQSAHVPAPDYPPPFGITFLPLSPWLAGCDLDASRKEKTERLPHHRSGCI